MKILDIARPAILPELDSYPSQPNFVQNVRSQSDQYNYLYIMTQHYQAGFIVWREQ